MIDLRKLRYFVAVAEEMHFRRAAERLNMSQPPLSQHIRRLEDEVGAQLFIRRTNTQVKLTPAGEKLLHGVRLALDQAERATSDARRAAKGELGVLRIGYTREFAHDLMPLFLARYHARHPEVVTELVTNIGMPILRKVYNEEVDIALLHRSPLSSPEGLTTLSLGSVPLYAILASSHPLSGSESVSWRELASTPFLMPDNNPSSAEAWKSLFFEYAGYVPSIPAFFSSADLLAEMVGHGMGWTVGGRGAFNRHDKRLSFVRLVEPEAPLRLMIVWRPKADKALVGGFIEAVEETLAEARSGASGSSLDLEEGLQIAAE